MAMRKRGRSLLVKNNVAIPEIKNNIFNCIISCIRISLRDRLTIYYILAAPHQHRLGSYDDEVLAICMV